MRQITKIFRIVSDFVFLNWLAFSHVIHQQDTGSIGLSEGVISSV